LGEVVLKSRKASFRERLVCAYFLNYAPHGRLHAHPCKAFAKFGPPWQHGFVWEVRGWLCGVQGQSVSDGDLQTFVDSLIVKAQ
jgi:hypothetical protein